MVCRVHTSAYGVPTTGEHLIETVWVMVNFHGNADESEKFTPSAQDLHRMHLSTLAEFRTGGFRGV